MISKKLLLPVLLAVAGLFGSAAAVAPLQESGVRLPPFSRFRLDNGMTVLLMEQHEVPIVSFNFIMKAGSVGDPAGKEGVSSLTADLLRRGTRSRTSDRVSSELDFIGGQFDMAASTDFTAGSAEFLQKDLQKGMDIVSDVLLNPIFPEDELSKAVQRNIDGIKSAKDRASNVIGLYFNAYLYGNHPYARPVGGDERSLAAISRADVVKFYETYYAPSNFILAAAGDFNTAQLRALIEERFKAWTSRPAPGISVSEPRPSSGKRLLLIDKPDSTQTYFYIGNLGISRTNPDRVAISVVNTLFGGRFTSRLNTMLRIESGLTYGASSQFVQRRLSGPFQISSYTRNETTEKAIDGALEVLKTLHTEGISEAELQSVKAYMKGQFPPTIETTDSLASVLTRQEYYGLDESDVNAYSARIDAVTLNEARRIIDKYYPKEDLVFVFLGKASEIESIAKKYAAEIDRKTITAPGY
jgi:predicted Zn-dependent peptidase